MDNKWRIRAPHRYGDARKHRYFNVKSAGCACAIVSTIVYSSNMGEVLTVFMRWLHISSMAALIGGMIYGRVVEQQTRGSGDGLSGKAAAAYRPTVLFAVAGLIVSGLYNYLTNPGHSPLYHMLFGIKVLLALHVFAVAFLVTQPVNPRRGRLMTGAAISGLAIIAISAYLRRIF